ncbi:hypothetical protein B4110_0781 [Parageobacillus toebii]|uniref:Uncharacterized protein n=1 Tax=Parageobacillus toebii TaxID=153151 RepID=A0A150N7V1_9BACL|nr:hypothetical protein B4110_0781 [Parageobacillus toebii]
MRCFYEKRPIRTFFYCKENKWRNDMYRRDETGDRHENSLAK